MEAILRPVWKRLVLGLSPALLSLALLPASAQAAPGGVAITPGAPTAASPGGGIDIHIGIGGSWGKKKHGGYHRPRPRPPVKVWVPGRWEIRHEKVWVPGAQRKEWRPARREVRVDSCGRAYEVVVSPGYWEYVHDPGRYEVRRQKVWVPGHWTHRPRY